MPADVPANASDGEMSIATAAANIFFTIRLL
jgi:hypothetical protein